MTMIAADELTDGKRIDLPPEAGDVTQPRFEPVEAWLGSAEPAAQKTAMWRWFATRYEELGPSTPRDTAGNYFFGAKGPPVPAHEVLRKRFGGVVPAEVVEQLIADVQARAGNEWAEAQFHKLGS
jgi:hypothetical protein